MSLAVPIARKTPPLRGFSLLWLLLAAGLASAQPAPPASIDGRWIVNDPDTRQPTAIIEIRTSGGVGGGTLAVPFDTPRDTRCEACPGALKNAPVWGLPLLDGLSIENGVWKGRILDPETGRYYMLELVADGDQLRITAHALLGLVWHHETWHRAPPER